MSALVVPCVADPLARPRWWRDGAMIAMCFALWIGAGLFSSVISTGAILLLGWLAYELARRRIALPLRVDDAFVSHSGHRVPIAGAKIAIRAWTGPGGRIGTVFSIGEGRRGIVIGCKTANVACKGATSEVDVVVDASDFVRLVRRFAPTVDASIYRQPAVAMSRRLWTNPSAQSVGSVFALILALNMVTMMVNNRYPQLSGIWLAALATLALAWSTRRPSLQVTQRALALTGGSVRLEESDGTALWTVIDARKRARVSRSGDVQTLELDPFTYPLRRIARGGLVRQHEEISAHLSAEDFDALVLALGLGAPPTRVAIEAEDDAGDDEAREERRRSERK